MVYRQHIRYIQARGLQCNPGKLFDCDLSKQIKEWRKQGERIVLLIDENNHPLHKTIYTLLTEMPHWHGRVFSQVLRPKRALHTSFGQISIWWQL
jgi:hypothetical protein